MSVSPTFLLRHISRRPTTRLLNEVPGVVLAFFICSHRKRHVSSDPVFKPNYSTPSDSELKLKAEIRGLLPGSGPLQILESIKNSADVGVPRHQKALMSKLVRPLSLSLSPLNPHPHGLSLVVHLFSLLRNREDVQRSMGTHGAC